MLNAEEVWAMWYRAARAILTTLVVFAAGESVLFAGPIPEIIGVIRCDTAHTVFGARIIPAGDENGDGYADFFVFDYRYVVFGFYGGPTPSNQPFIQIDNVTPNGSCNPGDINQDGYQDFAFKGRGQQNAYLNGFFGGPSMDSVRDVWFRYPGTLVAGNVPRVCPLIGNGQLQLVSELGTFTSIALFDAWPLQDSLPVVTIGLSSPGEPFALVGYAMETGDFNGDGECDLVTSYLYGGQDTKSEVVFYWGGQNFDTVPDYRYAEPGQVEPGHAQFGQLIVNLGDVNADGYDDLWVGHGNSQAGRDYVYFCGPALDSTPDVTMIQDAEYAANAGDVNDDGYDDLIVSFPLESSCCAYVWLYFGGPTMDGNPDIEIYAADMPEYNTLLGLGIAGVGDVNGDGIDDFAVSARDNNNRGMVYVFAGKSTVVSVPDPPENVISSFELYPNYPNPFNSSTVISFTLARHSTVTVTIFNMLGQVVDVPVRNALSSGEHRVEWPSDKRRQSLASGPYIVRLEAGKESRTQKMMLLK